MDDSQYQLANIDAERQFLAWMLRDPSLVRRYRLRVPAQDFSDLRYRWLWYAALDLEFQGLAIDKLALANWFEGKPAAEKVSADLIADIVIGETSANLDTCARLINEKAIRRRLQVASTQLSRLALDPLKDLELLETESREALRQALANPARLERLKTPDMRAENALARYNQLTEGDPPDVVPFGWKTIDALFGGARKGQFIVVAGASGHGKSAMMQSWANNAGLAGKKALYFECEMPEADLTDREVARMTNIPLNKLRRSLKGEGLGERLYESVMRIPNSNVWIWDDEPITPSLIEAVADEMASSVGLDIIFVDYLQIVTPDKELRDKRLEIEEISGRLRRLARTMNIPVVAGSQLNMGYASREDKRPQPQDLRESGKIYNDAWIVIGLYRPGAMRGAEGEDGQRLEDNTIEVSSLKNRQDGPQNETRVLAWDGPLTDIYDPTEPRTWQEAPERTVWWNK